MTRNENIARLAHRLGHESVGIARTRRGDWFSYCSCGWVSTTSVRLPSAAGAATHHLTSQARLVESDALTHGITLEAAIARYLANPPAFRDSGARAAAG